MTEHRDAAVAMPAPQEMTILAETFRLLGDPTRLRILFSCMAQAQSVGDIAAGLGLSQSLVSHHLRLLRGARLVRGERRAKQVFYALADRHVSDMLADMATHIAEDRGADEDE
jgi:DNA-binding transcriptional ArsR family regulator